MDGEQGVAIAKRRLLEHLPTQPSADPGFAVSRIATHVSSLAGSSLASFISVDMKGHIDTCSSIVQAISAKSPPVFSKGQLAEVVQLFVDRLSHLPVWTELKTGGPTHRGADALGKNLEDVNRHWAKGGAAKESLKASSISNFRVFWWLATTEMCEMADQVEKALKAKHGVDQPHAVEEGGAASSTGPAAKKPKVDPVRAKILSSMGGF